jgi:predicted secreted protein
MRIALTALVAALTSATAGGAEGPRIITQRDSGKQVVLRRGEEARLRLSGDWVWSTPRATRGVLRLVAVEYFVDPGFREWEIHVVRPGTATIKTVGSTEARTRRVSVAIVAR